MNDKTKPCKKLKILASGDPLTLFNHLRPDKILERVGPPRRLLSTSAKVEKCLPLGILTRILYLTPGVFCPAATLGCLKSCLGHTSGRMGFPTHARARDARAALYLENPDLFLRRLRAELVLLETDALQYDLSPAVRLNGTSDLRWERLHPDLFVEFSDLQFFDYTKLYVRVLDFLECTFPANYHLTFSVDAHNTDRAIDLLGRGGNVAAVFWPQLPSTWRGFPVIDGDLHDARFLDPAGVVVGLLAKGLARVDTSGFTIRICQNCVPETSELQLLKTVDDTHRTTIHQCPNCKETITARWALPQLMKNSRAA